MSVQLATRRLIDAAATLAPADRALLNLWTQRGLDAEALARMTGVDPTTIEKRRARIVGHLSTELGLAPEDVFSALGAIADSAAAAMTENSADTDAPPDYGSADPVLSSAPGAPAARPEPSVEPAGVATEAPPEPEPPSASAPSRRRGPWISVALLIVVAIAIVIVASSSGRDVGMQSASVASAPPATASTAAATAASPSATASATTPAPAPAARGPRTLAPLPGGVAGASGAVTLVRAGSTQSVRVRTHGLPVPGRDHYEVFLYNSIIDSRPLGRLPAEGDATLRLPAGAGRYAGIDISRQSPGTAEPSGASVLRAPDPLAGVAP